MSFTPVELDAMRALIRARTGLPDPPRRVQPAPWSEPSPPLVSAQPPPPDLGPAELAAAIPLIEAADPEPPPAAAEPEVEAFDGWRVDADIHRLVELLMRMRALSCADPLGRSSVDPTPAQMRAA